MPDLTIFEPSGHRLGLVQNLISMQWQIFYQRAGEVKLVARATPENLELLREGHRIHLTGQYEAAQIESVELLQNRTGAEMTVRGRLTAARLDGRVAMGSLWVENAEQGMYALVRNNLRELGLSLAEPAGYTETANVEISWGSVLEGLEKLADLSGLGFRVVFNPNTGHETLHVYRGTDRQSGDTYNGWLGDDIGNVRGAGIELAMDSFKNVAVVAGEGQGSARTVVFAALNGAQDDRRNELYVDAKNLGRTYQTAVNTGRKDSNGNPVFTYTSGTYTEAAYLNALRGRGFEELAKHTRLLSASLEADETVLRWRRDFDLGDILPVKLNGFGLRLGARVSSIKWVIEAPGDKTILGFDNFELEA